MSKTATSRLDKLLANMGYASRREIQMLARNGRIFLDGAPIASAEQRIAITPDLRERLVVDGEPLDPLPGLVVMVNKPLGMTCSHKEAGALIYDLLPTRWRRRDPAISTVGRLDKETSGLILLTDDGALLHRIISPKNHVAKHYLATLDRPLEGSEAELFASGTLMLEGEAKPLLPAELEVLSPHQARLAITEGRYHQVRRMFAATGNHVTALHRESLGGLTLPPGLQAGEFQLLTTDDIAAIWA
ncbi:rRNA pseudouridine synthase [Aureimonas fodinaquatilis]|uniref:Pseudouridine synthase n=1 Tax=Aureimonas fodinaquatilis TaxID=2565783 RepID=A0A5B0DSQ2_9HYPH|nr:pseudouridine synthase [Aureimonas fodinaquatilis]KAA0969418.1 rRNA pseudouridine synthase [Aureimonas fodinaquatilis]